MRLTRVTGSALLAALLLAAPVAAPHAQAAGDVAVPTVTRLVKLFLAKEASLGTAIGAGDATALGALLTDDFEFREDTRAASPVPRAEWMRDALAARLMGGEIRGMAVHDFGNIAIASFTQTTPKGFRFVVDVWQAAGSDWKLAVRYATSAAIVRAPAAQPVPHPADIPKKY